MVSFIRSFSHFLDNKTSTTGNPKLNSEVFAYALTIILLNLTAFGGIILFAWLLDTLQTTIILWLAFFSLRIFSGGRHQAGPAVCWVLTVTVFTALGFFVTYAAPLISHYTLLLEASGFIFALYAVIAYAPVTIASKNFDKGKRSRLKTMAALMITLWAALVFNPTAVAAVHDPVWSLAITTGLGAQAFSILPINFKNLLKTPQKKSNKKASIKTS